MPPCHQDISNVKNEPQARSVKLELGGQPPFRADRRESITPPNGETTQWHVPQARRDLEKVKKYLREHIAKRQISQRMTV